MTAPDPNDGATHGDGCYAWGARHYECLDTIPVVPDGGKVRP